MGQLGTAQITPAFFKKQMLRIMGLKFAPADLQTHWEALRELPESLLTAAIDKAQRDCDEFPAPKMLKAYADQARSRVMPPAAVEDRSEPIPKPLEAKLPNGTVIPITRFWKYYCADCNDLGWRSYACGADAHTRQPWLEQRHCGRHAEHPSHDWSRPCPCADTNPEVQRRRAHHAQTPARGESRQ